MPEPNPASRLRRLLGLPGRKKLLIVVGVVLVVIFATRSCSGVDVEKEQAIATARAALEADPDAFPPEDTEAKILRQGFPPQPVWVVLFTVRDPDGGPEDFLHHAAVWVDARRGNVRLVNISGSDEG